MSAVPRDILVIVRISCLNTDDFRTYPIFLPCNSYDVHDVIAIVINQKIFIRRY